MDRHDRLGARADRRLDRVRDRWSGVSSMSTMTGMAPADSTEVAVAM